MSIKKIKKNKISRREVIVLEGVTGIVQIYEILLYRYYLRRVRKDLINLFYIFTFSNIITFIFKFKNIPFSFFIII